MFNHKPDSQNQATDAQSRQALLTSTLQAKLIIGFNSLRKHDEDFQALWNKCFINDNTEEFHLCDGYLFMSLQLFLPTAFMRTYIMQKFHDGGLATHTGRDKL